MEPTQLVQTEEYTQTVCHFFNKNNERECPSCGFTTIKGMPGGADSTCKQCGYKDPCCYDY